MGKISLKKFFLTYLQFIARITFAFHERLQTFRNLFFIVEKTEKFCRGKSFIDFFVYYTFRAFVLQDDKWTVKMNLSALNGEYAKNKDEQ